MLLLGLYNVMKWSILERFVHLTSYLSLFNSGRSSRGSHKSYRLQYTLCGYCRPYSVEDLQVIDLEFFNSLKYVLDNDPEPLALTFAIEEQSFGVVGVAITIFNSCVLTSGVWL